MNRSAWASTSIRERFEDPDRTIEVNQREGNSMETDERPAAQFAHRVKVKHGKPPFKAAREGIIVVERNLTEKGDQQKSRDE